MKTPDEIKKGLECCTIPVCAECPYDSEPSCVVKNEDALAYIQQLEKMLGESFARNAPALEAAYGLAEKVRKLEAELETVKRERDTLLHYLTNTHIAPCDICKHEPESHDINDCARIRKVGVPCFEWVGLPEV